LFVVIDADSYRLIQEDLPVADQLGTLKDLPEGIEFEPSSDTSDGYSVRFNRLGNYCNPIDSSCDDPPTDVCSPSEITQRCSYNADGAYVETNDSPAGSVAVTLWERSTDLRTSVRLVPGGRVLQFPGWED
jgi:hypothetical protein